MKQPPKASPKIPPLSRRLIDWYRTAHRALPWRGMQDPYAIWVSEIMLQQTQVATVLPYYERFLTRYPTISALAHASIDEVLKTWEGLGYYARARNMYKAAGHILQDHQGCFPETFDTVHALPGIGRSTAGAILTFAFRKPHPILDGNVKRVLSRLHGIDQPLDMPEILDRLWEYSASLLPVDPDAAYDLNQALMELGATLCTPKEPQCDRCPWQSDCQALARGQQNVLPIKKPAAKTPHYTIAVGVVWQDDRVLIALRPEAGLLGGLWEFPGGKCQPEESLSECVLREIQEETGLCVRVNARIATVKHAYTHFKITLHAFHCDYVSGTATPRTSQAVRWVTLAEIDDYAFPTANKKVLEALKAHPGQQLLLAPL